MTYYGTINAVDKSGWSRAFPIEKALVTIGSGPVNDIVLPPERGDGVLPIHLQLFSEASSASSSGDRTWPEEIGISLRLLNLAPTPVELVSAKGEHRPLGGNSAARLNDGDILLLGDFCLKVSIHIVTHFERKRNLGVTLELPERRLRAGKRMTGRMTIHNYHPKLRYQVKIDIDGLPEACYKIEPAPLLPPLGEESLLIHFKHTRTHPAAGVCPFTVRVTAPQVFPVEEIRLEETLEVEPVYAYQLTVEKTNLESQA